MKRRTSIHATGALLGALMALSVAARGAQDNRFGASEPSVNSQEKTGQPAKLSDAERADIFMARKSYAQAIQYYSLAIKSKPEAPQYGTEIAALWNKLGICYQQMMGYEEARKAYKQAIRLDRNFAQPWNNLGTSYYLTNKPKKSIKFYRHAVKLSPEVASFHWNLGTSYFARRKYEEAIKEYRAAIQLDPDIMRQNSRAGTAIETRRVNARFYFYMAKIFASIGNASEAVRYLEHAMEEGFNNRDRILQDPDIKKISGDPAFIALMKNPPVAIKD